MALRWHAFFALFGQTPERVNNPLHKEIIMPKTRTEKRTVVGRVVNVSAPRAWEGESVINVDIELRGVPERTFVDLAFWGAEAAKLIKGKRLNDEMTKWIKFQDPIRPGVYVRATGGYKVKSWKPTKSKKLPKTVKKGQLSIYSHEQVQIIRLPK
jgi:hypothetical protein